MEWPFDTNAVIGGQQQEGAFGDRMPGHATMIGNGCASIRREKVEPVATSVMAFCGLDVMTFRS